MPRLRLGVYYIAKLNILIDNKEKDLFILKEKETKILQSSLVFHLKTKKPIRIFIGHYIEI
jgi:hypothetical protein